MSTPHLVFVPVLVLLGAPLLLPGAPPRSDPNDQVDPREIAKLQARYAVVEEELTRADVSDLAPDQLAARSRILAALNEYRLRGDFGHDHEFRGARVPCFVDHSGRRCAVAELLHATGEDRLVQEVLATDNHAWVVDLSRDTRFSRWLRQNGLSLWEAARIQVPSVDGGASGWRRDSEDRGGSSSGGAGSGRSYRGPGDTVPSSSGGASPASPSSAPAPSSGTGSGGSAAPRPASAGPSGPRLPGLPTALNLTTEADDGW